MSLRQDLLSQLRTNLYKIRGDGNNALLNEFIDWCCKTATGLINANDDMIDYQCCYISIIAVDENMTHCIDDINRIIKDLIHYRD